MALFLFPATSAHAMLWEIGIRVQNQSNNLIQGGIDVYGYNPDTKNYVSLCSPTFAAAVIHDSYNVIFNVDGISDDDPYALATLTYYPAYVFLIGNNYIRVDMPFSGWQDYNIVYTQNANPSWGSASAGSQSSGTWTNYNITLKNNMGYDNANGTIYLNSESIVTGTSGVTKMREASTFPHTISGEEQTVGGVYRKWREWTDNTSSMSRELQTANTYEKTARYARQYSASISTNLGGGEVYINGTPYNCTTSNSYIYDDLNNTITAYDQEYSGFSCTFDHWEQNSSFYSSQNGLTFSNPASGVTLTAVFTKKISNVGEGLYFGSTQNDPIVLYWEDNQNATSYQIWRKVKINGVWQSPYQIATVSTGEETYTDGDYKLNAWKQGIELEYDARAVSSSYSQDPYWSTVYGSVNAKMSNGLAEGIMLEKETPSNYSIGSFPNPFNPTTSINYQLPKDGMVTIKVYDIIGKEIASLVNGHKTAGYYKVDFDASRMTSGVYIATIQASIFNKSIKLLLTK